MNRALAVEEEMVTSLAVRPGVVDTEMQALIRTLGADGMPAEAHQRFVRLKEGANCCRRRCPAAPWRCSPFTPPPVGRRLPLLG
ncbi:MAG: hypothetical protein M5U34_20620 [Chloroflexi bacterium]|nr:hypothetical protein [Chloroflexota bacterium]